MRHTITAIVLSTSLAGLPSCATKKEGRVPLAHGEKVGLLLATAGIAGSAMAVGEHRDKVALAVALAAPVAATTISILILGKRAPSEEQREVAVANAEQSLAARPEEEEPPRYIAVPTVRAEGARGEAELMIYDTVEEELATEAAYDVRLTPESGSLIELDGFVTEYVGNGDATGAPAPAPEPKPEPKP